MTNEEQNEFVATLAHLAQHIVNISYEEYKIGRRIFIINHVGNEKKCNLKDVVDYLKLPKSTATRQVDHLVKENLVNREIPDGDRRTVELTLTGKGKKVYTWFQEHLTNVLTTVSQEYSENDLNLALRVFPRLVDLSEEFLKKTGHWRQKQK
ncbi:MAG: MarR family winged helix-turn-helix transcriptional regulator [Candidatus Hodarchaeales archaeon]